MYSKYGNFVAVGRHAIVSWDWFWAVRTHSAPPGAPRVQPWFFNLHPKKVSEYAFINRRHAVVLTGTQRLKETSFEL